jgi:hypothetical protein
MYWSAVVSDDRASYRETTTPIQGSLIIRRCSHFHIKTGNEYIPAPFSTTGIKAWIFGWTNLGIQRHCEFLDPRSLKSASVTRNQSTEPEAMCHVRVSELWCSCMWFRNMWKVSRFVSATSAARHPKSYHFRPKERMVDSRPHT